MPVPRAEASFPTTRQQLPAKQCSLSPLGGNIHLALAGHLRWVPGAVPHRRHVSSTRGPAPVTQEEPALLPPQRS